MRFGGCQVLFWLGMLMMCCLSRDRRRIFLGLILTNHLLALTFDSRRKLRDDVLMSTMRERRGSAVVGYEDESQDIEAKYQCRSSLVANTDCLCRLDGDWAWHRAVLLRNANRLNLADFRSRSFCSPRRIIQYIHEKGSLLHFYP